MWSRLCKISKRNVDTMYTEDGLNMPYDHNNSYGKTYGEHKKKLELSQHDFKELKKLSDELNIDFSASVWDIESADFVDTLNVPFFKIASADLTNYPLLRHVANKGKPVFYLLVCLVWNR